MDIDLPIEVVYFVLNNRVIKPTHLRTFLYIKAHFPDRFKYDHQFILELTSLTGRSAKSIEKHVHKLKGINWLGFDRATKYLYVRGKSNLNLFGASRSNYSVLVPVWQLENIYEILLGAVVAFHVRMISCSRNRPELANGGSLQGYVHRQLIMKGFAATALSFLAGSMHLSIARIHKIKVRAAEKGIIEIHKDYISTHIAWNPNARTFATDPRVNGRVRKRDGRICLVGIDLIKSNLKLLKRKKRKRI